MQRRLSLFLVWSLLLASCSTPVADKEADKQSGPPAHQEQASRNQPTPSSPLIPSGQGTPAAAPPVADAQQRAKVVGPMALEAAPLAKAAVQVPGRSREIQPVAPPAWNRESYNAQNENGFVSVQHDPLSTFSIDVDTASYANVRRFIQGGMLPPAGAVRIEELINYFSYSDREPTGRDPLALSAEVGPSPFHDQYQLVRIGLTARNLPKAELPPSNLVFLVDVSGSMQDENKLPLLQQALSLLVKQLDKRDRVALVVYAGSDRVVLQPTSGNQQQEILAAIEQLRAGGSTHASSGIRTAYQLAREHFIKGGNNRVILASDGDFNVGVTSRDELQRLIERERQAGVYLTVLGFGMGNYHDDTMEILADKGNGNYAYIDSLLEAKKVLVKELSGTLFTLAGDVKIQVEFNPARVGAYRLIGYENRMLAAEDFRDDRKDAGEIGVGHRVSALYELVPAGHAAIPQLDPLKYQATKATATTGSRELMTVKLRYKPQLQAASRELSLPVGDGSVRTTQTTSEDFRFAAAVAGYGLLLTHSPHLGQFTWAQCLAMAKAGRGADSEGYRAEFARLVEASQLLAEQGKGVEEDPATPLPVPTPMPRRLR